VQRGVTRGAKVSELHPVLLKMPPNRAVDGVPTSVLQLECVAGQIYWTLPQTGPYLRLQYFYDPATEQTAGCLLFYFVFFFPPSSFVRLPKPL
jgi:hypothetical protein